MVILFIHFNLTMDFTVTEACQTSGFKHRWSAGIKRAHTIFQLEKYLWHLKEILLLSIEKYFYYLQKYLPDTPVKETPLIQIFMQAWINVHVQGGGKQNNKEEWM